MFTKLCSKVLVPEQRAGRLLRILPGVLSSPTLPVIRRSLYDGEGNRYLLDAVNSWLSDETESYLPIVNKSRVAATKVLTSTIAD